MYVGGDNEIIWIDTSDDFGIVNLFLTIQHENGKLIESGNVCEFPDEPNRWAYLTQASVSTGTTVTVRVAAIDGFGNMSTRSERITVTLASWRVGADPSER